MFDHPSCFLTFCRSGIPTSCYIFNVFYYLYVIVLLHHCITVLGWIASSPVEEGSTEKLVFCKLHFQSPESTPDVEFSLQISGDFFWKAAYCGKELQHECIILGDSPHTLNTAQDVVSVIDKMNSSEPCQGNPDDRFMALLPSRKGVFRDPTGTCKVYVPVCALMI